MRLRTLKRKAGGRGSDEKYVPQSPTERQEMFLSLNDTREVFYGGAAGGGKSSCLLMSALEYVHVPGYAALLLRKTYQDLAKPGALMDRAHQWLRGTSAKWNEQKKQWTFPSGATLTFGYLENENDKYQYQGAEFQYVGFDELTQFKQSAYTYLFSRLRRLQGSEVPLRMRAASNPGGIGALWVHERFIPDDFTPSQARENRVFWKESISEDGRESQRAFVPATLEDNPHLDRVEYEESLDELDPVTREQLLHGDWSIKERGDILSMWDERYHVISWSEFAKVFGVTHIPDHWLLGVYQDMGQTEGHPCVTSWFAKAAENSPLPGALFLYRGHCAHDWTIRDLATHMREAMARRNEIGRTRRWRMSHEALSERIEYNRVHKLPFQAWTPGRTRGVAQLRAYHQIIKTDEAGDELRHPFRPHLIGRPMMYHVVSDEELRFPKTDAGLARWRAEAPTYKWRTLANGDPTSVLEPDPQFNDAMDTEREACADYGPPLKRKTREELREEKLAPEIQAVNIPKLPTIEEQDRAVASRQFWLDQEKKLEELANPIRNGRAGINVGRGGGFRRG